MKPNLILKSAFLILLPFAVIAQENTRKSKPKIVLSDLYITTGFINQRTNIATLGAFQKFVPQSRMLNADLTEFSVPNGTGSHGSSILSAMAGLQFGKAKKGSLRLRISLYAMPYADTDIYKETATPTDTLTSSQTGEKTYLYRVDYQSYNLQNYSAYLRLDAAYIYYFNPDALLSFFTGAGIGGIVSRKSATNISRSEFSYTRTSDANGTSYSGFNPSMNYEDENFKSKGNSGAIAYIPVGADLQLGQKNDFFKRIHLLYEFRPTINAQYGALGNFYAMQWQHNFGIKYALK